MKPTASKMFIKIAKLVKTSHYHERTDFRRELVGHVIDECVNRSIHSCKCM